MLGCTAVAGVIAAAAVSAVVADGPPHGTFFQGWPTQVGDDFGAAVAIDGRTVVVGAPLACPDGAAGSGRAYLFRSGAGGWAQVDELDALAAAADRHFGCAVAVSGDMIMVGASGAAPNGASTGATFVYHDSADSPKPISILTGQDSVVGDCFGHAVAMDEGPRGRIAVVGAPGRDGAGGGEDVGAVYVLRLIDGIWIEEACLVPADAAGAAFGMAVDVSRDFVVASGGDDTVRVFRTDGANWWQDAVLEVPSAGKLAHPVALSGLTLAVGAPSETGGAVHLFRHGMSTWYEVARLAPLTDEITPAFGRAVAIHDTTVLVGGTDLAWVFAPRRGVWTQVERLNDVELDPSYGVTVALAGDLAVVGAPRAYEFGAVFVHDLDRSADVDGDGVVDGRDLIAVLAAWGPCPGCAADITDDGSVDTSDLLQVLMHWGDSDV